MIDHNGLRATLDPREGIFEHLSRPPRGSDALVEDAAQLRIQTTIGGEKSIILEILRPPP